MRRCAWLGALLLLCCRTAAPSPERGDGAQVSSMDLQFPEPGKGELSFSLVVPAASTGAVATLVRWELWLKGRPFASGVTRLSSPAPGGPGAVVEVKQALLYGAMGYDPHPHRLEVRLVGEVTSVFASGDLSVAFETQTRLEVAAAPIVETPEG